LPRLQVELPGESQGAGFKSALGPSSPRRLLRWWGRYRGNMNAEPGRVIPGYMHSTGAMRRGRNASGVVTRRVRLSLRGILFGDLL